ncbi:hypothetical protein [Pueribacillus sp. YX66]|uniref:hypothetical protein n=1 Tax=Pueribacillus sp. YX66 TaxID=3229242 RepID=UPI00358D4A82
MSQFEKIVIENEELLGKGFYEKTDTGLIIKSSDQAVKDFFKTVIRNKKSLGTIEFYSNSGFEGMHSGRFRIRKIDGDTIVLTHI